MGRPWTTHAGSAGSAGHLWTGVRRRRPRAAAIRAVLRAQAGRGFRLDRPGCGGRPRSWRALHGGRSLAPP
jgi:hypothetical protein